ncbi:SDR family oxidoreductase [Devosia sp. CAU 1758]
MSFDMRSVLSGKRVVITGATRGIGAAIVDLFARNGARLAMVNRRPAAMSGHAEVIEALCDLADLSAVPAAIGAVIAELGGIDILINNAGTIEPIARVEDSDPAAWAGVVQTNLVGAFAVTHAVLPAMLKAGGGTIINVSSGAAIAPLEGWSHYCASKAGLRALTACLDLELRAKGIRALGISPGTVATGMQGAIRRSGLNPVSRLDPNVHIAPLWVAQSIAWLSTPEADRFLGTDFSLKTEEGRKLAGLPHS